MVYRICILFLAAVLFLQPGAFAWTMEKPKVSFYEKAGWLDHLSNTMRRVALRGEKGAYDSYKNNNPSPRNVYESVNIHQANLTDLGIYRNSSVYQQAQQWRNAFLPAEDETEETTQSGALSAADLAQIRTALAELMNLYHANGAYYPIVTQAVLEVSRQMLPLQKQYALFSDKDVASLKKLFHKILSSSAKCGQGEGYRLFCEGRADALDGLAVVASAPQDAQLIARVLKEDIQQPFIARELLTGTAALLALKQEALLDGVLAEAVDEEGESFWQKIDVFMTGWWLNKVQYRNGRYLGNVTALAVLPGLYGQADGNAWEEMARLLYNEGRPSAASSALLAKYGLGSCQADMGDFSKGQPITANGELYFSSVRCQTLLPFLAGALAAGARNGANAKLQQAAQKLNFSPASLVARLYFENIMGDLNAETELRLDNLLYGVFEKDVAALKQRRSQAAAHNRKIDEQLQPLLKRRQELIFNPLENLKKTDPLALPERWELESQIANLEKQKIQLPALPDPSFKNYDRQSGTYRRKVTGQKIYQVARQVSSAVDLGLGIYYTAALPAAAVKGVQWGVSLKRGMDAVRAGRVTADARKLASLSARLKKIRALQAKSAQRVKTQLSQALASINRNLPARPSASGSKGVAVPAVSASGKAQPKGTTLAEPVKALPAAQPKVLPAAPAPKLLAQQASASKPVPSLRQVRLTAQTAKNKADFTASSVQALQADALQTLQQMQQMQKEWKGFAKMWVEELRKDPVRMEEAVRQAGQYAQLERDLAFYQTARQTAKLPEDKLVSVAAPEEFLFSASGRQYLAQEYVALLQNRLAALDEGKDPFKALLTKKLYAAVKQLDDMTDPAQLLWKGTETTSLPAMRARVSQLRASGQLSAVQQREAADIWRQLQTTSFADPDVPYLLRLRILNLPFLQKSPNTLWIIGDGFSGYDLFMRKTPFGFPLTKQIKAQPFDKVSKFFQKGRENVLFINGHGYVSQNGQWKGILRQAIAGETRPAATISAEKIIQGALQADSPHTSVYVHSCQTGALFNDLPALFEKYPQAARKTDWFAFSAPQQPASSRPIPAEVSGNTVRERLLNKLLLNMTDNGAGLAARAWVDGRDLYPLRASVQRLEREIAAAPKDKQPALQALQEDLEMLLDIANASDQNELARAMEAFSMRYPQQVKYADRAVFAGAFNAADGGEFLWGLEPWSVDISFNMAPFVQLKKQWVDYVADTAKEMFDLFKTPSVAPKLPESKNLLRLSAPAQKELDYAGKRLGQIFLMQKLDNPAWTSELLHDAAVRDMAPAIEQSRMVMHNLKQKWTQRGVNSVADLKDDPALMKEALQDLSHYAKLERELPEAEQLFALYNQQAGVPAWIAELPKQNNALFSNASRRELAERYLILLKKWRETQPPALRAAADREIANIVKWSDEFAMYGSREWRTDVLPAASAIRLHFQKLGKSKKDFSALQLKEYNSLKRALYKDRYLSGEEMLELQNRLTYLPHLEKTPNAVFLWGDGLGADQAWARKTLFGFYRPQIAQFLPLEEVLNLFKEGQENVLLMHVRGGISRHKKWKGIVIDGAPYPNLTFSAKDFLREIPKVNSKHNSVYINGCFSGHLLDDLLQAKDFKKLSNTDWFVTAAPMQHAAKETLPADFVSGSVRDRLFGKMLQRMSYNGDGLAARAFVDGKEIYPLRESLSRLDREIKRAAPEQQKPLLSLRQDLGMLYNIAQSPTNDVLLANLRALQKKYPLLVLNMEEWQPGSQRLLMQASSWPADRVGPNGFFWGKEQTIFTIEDYVPFVTLRKKWVDYVTQTAQDLFARVPKYPKGIRPVFAAEDFKPVFSSPTAKYIFEHRTMAPFDGRVEASFFRIPVQLTPVQDLAWNGSKSVLKRQAQLQQEYAALIAEFEGVKKDVNTSFYYAKNRLASLDMMERRALRDRMLDLRAKMLFFQKKNLQTKALQSPVDWLDNAVETLLPLQRGRVLEAPAFARPDRVYSHKEFFLRDPNGKAFKTTKKFASYAQKDKWLQAKRASLPKNLRVAVLNDDGQIIANYQGWLKKANIGENAEWSFYRGIDEFMAQLHHGKEFDLILTDLNFPDGGSRYVVSWLRQNGNNHTAVIASSSFPDEAVNGAQLLAEGFDGYLSTRYLTLAKGEENLLRALNNYFKYRDKNGWAR